MYRFVTLFLQICLRLNKDDVWMMQVYTDDLWSDDNAWGRTDELHQKESCGDPKTKRFGRMTTLVFSSIDNRYTPTMRLIEYHYPCVVTPSTKSWLVWQLIGYIHLHKSIFNCCDSLFFIAFASTIPGCVMNWSIPEEEEADDDDDTDVSIFLHGSLDMLIFFFQRPSYSWWWVPHCCKRKQSYTRFW